MSSALMAFLHHLAAFTLVSAVAIEFVLLKPELTLRNARIIQVADMVFGISAGILLLVGFGRVFSFEKGAYFYFHTWTFLAKLTLFVLVGLASIIPTIEFLRWRADVKQGRVPMVDAARMRTVRMIIHAELAGIVLIILCAALMAKGIGSVR
jgi:putative membrane protein